MWVSVVKISFQIKSPPTLEQRFHPFCLDAIPLSVIPTSPEVRSCPCSDWTRDEGIIRSSMSVKT